MPQRSNRTKLGANVICNVHNNYHAFSIDLSQTFIMYSPLNSDNRVENKHELEHDAYKVEHTLQLQRVTTFHVSN